MNFFAGVGTGITSRLPGPRFFSKNASLVSCLICIIFECFSWLKPVNFIPQSVSSLKGQLH